MGAQEMGPGDQGGVVRGKNRGEHGEEGVKEGAGERKGVEEQVFLHFKEDKRSLTLTPSAAMESRKPAALTPQPPTETISSSITESTGIGR